jgi:ubiquitin-protein ligase E3 A
MLVVCMRIPDMQVQFAGEDGVDEGGLSREFFQLIVKECFSPKYGMFVNVPSTNVCWFRASALSNLSDELELIGTLGCLVTRYS